MKRNLLYKWALAVILVIASFTSAFADIKVTSLDQLTAGDTIKIYPYGNGGVPDLALACKGNGGPLTSYTKAGDGDEWTLEDAGDGYYYLKNELGCYWAYQNNSTYSSLTCTTTQSSAVKVKLTWDSTNNGVCFWNQTDGKGLNNLYSYNYLYNWYSSPSSYNNGDTNTTFNVYLKQSDATSEEVEEVEVYVEGIKYRLNRADKTAEVSYAGNISGNIEIPEYVESNSERFVVTSLRYCCFSNCRRLTSITLPNSITTLGVYCFSGCSSLTSITLPSGITSLEKDCFSNCSRLTSITLPDGITSLGLSCFSGCSSLTSITLPNSITSLGAYCFEGCSSLTSITLPSSITWLGANCFEGCSSLTSVTLPNGITTLHVACFYGCSSLTSIALPNSITSLEGSCFFGCTKLSYIEFPSTLQTIGEDIFESAMQEKTIVSYAVTPPNYKGTDNFIDSNASLIVHKNTIDTYKNATPWKAAKSIQSVFALPNEVSVERKDSKKLQCTVNSNVKDYHLDGLKWTSSNATVASVDETSGVVTGNKVGDAVITATITDGTNASASTTVHVTPLKVTDVELTTTSAVKTVPTKLEVKVLPVDADIKKMTWKSLTPTVASVTEDGTITGQETGTAQVQSTTTDGSNISKTFNVEITPLSVSGISLPKEVSIVKTNTTKLEYTVSPAASDNQQLKWASSNTAVASVDETTGAITANKVGDAVITAIATDGSGVSASTTVHVTPLPVSSISLPKEVSIVKTDAQKVDYTVSPTAADNQKLKWTSDNAAVASVDETTGIITANKVGDAVITATATDGSKVSASTTVHVTPLSASSLSITNELTLLRTNSQKLEVSILPELTDNKTLEWSSDNESVATVDQNGVVKGISVGTANITANTTDGSNLSANCKVTVNPVVINLSTQTINLQKGWSYTEQEATVLPDSYEHKDVVWSASGNGVASVDAKGNITAIKPGVDTIRCSLSYDSNIYSECCVIVYDENVVYVGGLYYILHNENTSDRWATVTSIYGGKNTSLDAANVAQYYSGTISIPETIIYDGTKYTVKKVGSYAFNCQNDLQSLYVPRTVTEIEPNAAIKAEKLNRVNVADESQLVNIGEEAFKWCTGLKRFTFDGTSLSMASIDKAAFRECTALERFVWTGNTSVKTIGHSAFYGCTALEQVLWKAKSELQTIQDYAFFKCSVLNNFAMPNTTLSVGNSAFRYNAGLTDIQLSISLNYIDEYAFGECGFSGITLPESLANIQAGAFINNEHLLAITLPERLQGLGSAAFENNSALQSVTFHTAIETMTIGNNAFNKCPVLNKVFITNMNSFAQTNFSNAKANPANTSQHIYDANGAEITKVVLPKGTKYVNNNAFNGCAYIESIEMPSTMDHVNDDIFVGCSALKDVYCYATEVPEFIGVNDPSSMNDVFNRATLHVPYGSESLYKNDTDWWGKFAMIAGCDPEPTTVVEKIELSTRTVNVKAGENYNEQKLTIYPEDAANVRIKYSTANRNVAEIDENGVIKGVAPGVTTIYYTANDGGAVTAECKVIVRDTEVEYVGDLYYLFDTGKKEATVTSIYGGKNKSLDAENVAQVYNGTVNIPEQTTFNAVTYDVKKVGSYAFTCQNDLQALRIGAFVDEIEDNAVTNAINLNRVTVANASLLKTIGKRSFMDCTGLQHVLFEGTTLQMEAINTAAFKNCTKLEDVIWEGKNTMTLIGDSAFYCDGKLETVKWNDQSNLKVIDSYAFYKCASLNHFIMPNSTQSVGKYAFRYNEGLTDIQLSASLSIIYDYAFGECGFSQITLPESLKSVQAGAFINNSYLAGITIPKDMEGIGAGAFENCSALASVTFKTHTTKLTVDKNAFNYCPVLSKVNIDHLDGFAQINFQNAEANPAYTAHRIYLNDVEIVDVELPTGTKYIGNNVFNGCTNIRTLKVPATVEHINDNIIANCSALRDVYCYATNVPDFIGVEDPSTMSDVFGQATLHVIYGNEAAYKADSWWGRFYNVEGCDNPDAEYVRVTSITISQENVTLKPDDTVQLETTVYPTNATNKKVKWSSSNDDVAMVTDEGFVLAVAEGEADITVESVDSTEIKAVCHIKVESEKVPVVPIVEIQFEESAATVGIGETKQLIVTYNPENASNKTLTWTSAKPAVATVDEEGVVTGVSEGKTIITAKTTDGSNLSTNCVVTVTKATGIGSITIGDVKIVIKDRHLTVEGLAADDVITVVNTIGFTVYHGTNHEVDLNASGVYIIKVKGKTLKVSIN